ncbi:hypothetical protein MTO96_050886 [Rhipicephalus appendiculatus]
MSLAFSSHDTYVGVTLTLASPPATLPVCCRLEDSPVLTSASSFASESAAIRAADRLHRLTGRGSPYCADCGDRESLDHLLLHCTALNASRTPMLAQYARLGLPLTTAQHLLFPHSGRDSVQAGPLCAARLFG